MKIVIAGLNEPIGSPFTKFLSRLMVSTSLQYQAKVEVKIGDKDATAEVVMERE